MHGIDIRPAVAEDVPGIVALLADDHLGAARESLDDLAPYLTAFATIDADPHQILAVAVRDGVLLATLQLTFLHGLSRRGMCRAQIEAVRVAAESRGDGLGGRLVDWAIDTARARGCGLVQLTSDNSRVDAHRFYEKRGFVHSHAGFKLALD